MAATQSSWITRLLGKLGIGPRDTEHATRLGASSTWKKFQRTCAQADDVACNRAGHCAMEPKGARKLTTALQQCDEQLGQLLEQELICQAEFDMLSRHAARLQRDAMVRIDKDATPDRIAAQSPAQKSLHDLSELIDVLENICCVEEPACEAVEMVLHAVDADIKTLGNRTMLRQLAMARRGEAGEIRSRSQKCVDQIRTGLGHIRLTA